MSAPKHPLEINQGETFETIFTVQQANKRPFDLTNYTVRSQVRQRFADVTPLVTFNCSVYDAVNGKIRIALTAAETAALSFDKAYYDVEFVSPAGTVTRFVQGTVKLSLEVTK